MARVTVGGIVQTALVTAFTIAAAFIWKDVIMDIIHRLVPPGEEIFYDFIAAIVATIFIIIAIYIIVNTEREAEIIIKRIEGKKHPKSNKKYDVKIEKV